MNRILVTHDGSKASDKALKKAVEIGLKFGASITVLSVIPELYLTELSDVDRERIVQVMTEETQNAMEKIRSSLSGKSIDAKIILRQGDPAEKILETAKKMKVDLIVTGSHGRHGAKKFLLGSVSSRIVDYSTCPVLVVK
ncbi:MAG: universal stress protein [Nitrospiraceae bacterium]|nr:universal stress protein [Nitrospiraceae bacterium]